MKRKHRLSNCPVVENGVDVYDAPITSELAAQTLCTAPTSLDKKKIILYSPTSEFNHDRLPFKNGRCGARRGYVRTRGCEREGRRDVSRGMLWTS